MFLGSYTPSFDALARRIALPKKIRAYLAKDEIILSYGFEKCLFGFDPVTWNKEANRQLESSIAERRSRDIRRFIFASAATLQLDDQGRFVIPSNLQKYARITKPVVIGAGDHFEIWDETIWEKELAKLETGQK